MNNHDSYKDFNSVILTLGNDAQIVSVPSFVPNKIKLVDESVPGPSKDRFHTSQQNFIWIYNRQIISCDLPNLAINDYEALAFLANAS